MGQGRLEGLRTEQIRSDADRPPPPAALLSTAASRIFAAMLVWNCADVRSLTCNPACNPLTAEMPESALTTAVTDAKPPIRGRIGDGESICSC